MRNAALIENDIYVSTDLKLEKVLVVEDEPLWQLLILKTLKKINKNVEVSFSETAARALSKVETSSGKQFDLIISDQVLQEPKTGLDLWNTLKEKKYNIPYVLLSGTPRNDFLKIVSEAPKSSPHYIEKQKSPAILLDQLNFFVSFNGPVVSKVVAPKKRFLRINYWNVFFFFAIVLFVISKI